MYISVCTRCGREGILFKKWVDRYEGRGNPITHEIYVCPDAECQKIVDAKFAEIRQRKLDLKNKKTEEDSKKIVAKVSN